MFNNRKLSIINKLDKKKYEISGEDIQNIIKILPYLTGTYNLDRICEITKVDTQLLSEIIEQLKSINLIQEYISNELELYIINDGGYKSIKLQKKLINNERLTDIEKFEGKDYLEKVNRISNKSLIICINSDYNKKFIQKIEELSLINKINYLNISIFHDKAIIGPLLSYEDGPCHKCLEKSLTLTSEKYSEPVPLLYDSIIEMIVHEVLRFTKQKTYVNTFNTAIEVDFSDLEFKKTKIYRYPNCNQCYVKGELV